MLLIRQECAGDAEVIAALHAVAHTDTDIRVPALVGELRKGSAWIPQLSLVAVENDDIVGHVLGTRSSVGGRDLPAIALAPLGVRPDRRGRGIGYALCSAAIATADAAGESLLGICGPAEFCARAGFVPAADYRIDWSGPAELYVRALNAYQPAFRGEFHYAAEFGAPVPQQPVG
ncbi:putative acetyltransferase [Tamaricihabitans halophyticus]|uniref:Putative acetyltransferase n=1 Tax=Tamaricihabitans halophyticus TaxID=1262583 RepID=A0A4R2QB06_9PSEU|nr:N-acetyltransferase [Tamaricihabitans halophyticus]TCP45444.1 putative acetyltransferase [Tamaricihabitans halophyticus]